MLLDPETARQVKWRNAVNPPQGVQPIANLPMRMERYRDDLARFYRDLAAIAILTALLLVPAFYFTPVILSAVSGTTVDPQHVESLWPMAVLFWLGMLVPVVMLLKPKRPTQQDVLDDIALRRQVGMDDTVAGSEGGI